MREFTVPTSLARSFAARTDNPDAGRAAGGYSRTGTRLPHAGPWPDRMESGAAVARGPSAGREAAGPTGFVRASRFRSRVNGRPLVPLMIVKNIRKTAPVRERGSWKIAYADFMTALMAFFLLLWLTSSLPQNDLLQIAEYFKTPFLVERSGGQSHDAGASLIPSNYGDDKTKLYGQVHAVPQAAEQVKLGETDARKLLRLQELARLQLLKRQLEQLIESEPKLNKYKNQLLIDLTTEGLRIQIVDEQNRPMFEMGSVALQPHTVEILRTIGNSLNRVPNKIGLSGHTDATPYQGGDKGYSNWELSVDRANASRRELIAGGIDQAKILRVVGVSSSALLNPDNPYDANNRRISIIVMNRETENSAREYGGQ